MPVHLLDSSALIAASVEEHVHFTRVHRWLVDVEHLAVCPITEGALIRFLFRIGESPTTAAALLNTLRSNPRVSFWSDDVSYLEVPLARLRGHRQVTDAYLVALAQSKAGVLATVDEGLHELHPESTVLIPQ